ncbi:Glutathione s-transferase u7 [Thalictrum thalictroides]|uniref:glutathione transferase n=1 Tax=Thalictrum thalictroides TaxID=46969 RepID=A0A7J6VQN6_THATH|nr:Glutathione s-transferase u7 [Thalictrum thalictroides]
MATDEVKLIGFRGGPFSLIVEWALKIKGVQYEYFDEDLFNNNKSAMLLQYNPVHKKVPVLVHNGKPLAESLVILEYIDETWKQNPLLPEDPYDRAMARFWAKYADDKCKIGIFSVFATVGEEQEKAAKEAREILKTFEMGLKGKFFGGKELGFVDIAAGWLAYWIGMIQEITGINLVEKKSTPLLSEWFQNFLNAEVVKERLPPRDELLEKSKIFREHLLAAAST